MTRKAFTIVELIIIVIIIGILATFAAPLFRVTKIKNIDQEAISGLNLIYDAEKLYKLEHETYVACGGLLPDSCDSLLKLDLRSANWEYSVSPAFLAVATRCRAGVLRTWHLDIVNTTDGKPVLQPDGACAGL